MTSTIYICWLLFLIKHITCDDPVETQEPKLPKPEDQLQIGGLTGTLSYDFLSQVRNVSKIKIFNNRITKIETGAICSSSSLKSLELNFGGNPQAPVLTKQVFKQCRYQLEELLLRFDYDSPSKIEHDALEDLTLRSLSLQCQDVGHLTKDFLKLNLHMLTRLSLSSCHLHEIDFDAFEAMDNLEELEISYNRKLTRIPKSLFRSTPKLKRLSLRYNRIKELRWNEFEGLFLLEVLDLGGNRIAFFDARKCSRSMPRLTHLDITKNLLPCKLKEAFAIELAANFNHSIVVVYNAGPCRN